MINKTFKYLGYQNSWKKLPTELIKCRELQHKRIHERNKNGVLKTECKVCKYYFFTDSSD